MDDLFEREQRILDHAVNHMNAIQGGASYDYSEFKMLVKEYGRLLKQLRRITRISDKTTVDLNSSKLDLLDKVHYDALTGIYNRRFLEDNLKRIVKNLSHSNGMISILMIDVDFFKKFNDTYGHRMGDECLRVVSKALQESLSRAEDFVARYGGEEFIIVLPNTDENGARTMASRVIERVKAYAIPHEKNVGIGVVTISVGVTSFLAYNSVEGGGEYISRADEALYMSKQNGRNRYTYISSQEEAK